MDLKRKRDDCTDERDWLRTTPHTHWIIRRFHSWVCDRIDRTSLLDFARWLIWWRINGKLAISSQEDTSLVSPHHWWTLWTARVVPLHSCVKSSHEVIPRK